MRLLDRQLIPQADKQFSPQPGIGDSDGALVAAAQTDPAAFAPLYQRYVDPVYRFCYRRLGERAAAEDATSRIFERALLGLANYREGSFRAWLFTIARNAVADVYRADRGERPLEAAGTIVDRAPGPKEIAADDAAARWIRGLLAQLAPDQRQVVELRLAGLTDLEIAQTLGKSHGSIRTAQYRALQQLRALFGSRKENEDATR